MTDENENRRYYKDTFREVHASEEMLRKVEAMGKEYQKRNGTWILRRSCVAAAALAIGLISSNIISYAATGSPWIITLIARDGREVPLEMERRTEDGITYYTGFVGEDEIPGTDLSDACRTVREEEHLYLDINGVFKIDITEALTTGNHEGFFEINGKKYKYLVGGTLEDNTLQVNAQE
ncbi:MAG: hypothetical protein HFJ10_16015 [Lachnospiraceae bacterium]|jgi:hypothetical protein|nr:hypothetical protein [Lachnospiraceae bacterium]